MVGGTPPAEDLNSFGTRCCAVSVGGGKTPVKKNS